MKPYIKRFLETVFPGTVELACCSLNEEGMLNAASDTIDDLNRRLALAEAVCEELAGSTSSDIVGSEGVTLLWVWQQGK